MKQRLILHSLAVAVMLGAAATARADDLPTETVQAAHAAGVDPIQLLGAVNSTGMEPYSYLYMTGELQRPVPVRSVWDAVAECESHQRWSINTGNGFYGGLQFHPRTWVDYGGLQYAPSAHLASRSQQITIAEKVLGGQGWRAWPVCSLRLGLRRG